MSIGHEKSESVMYTDQFDLLVKQGEVQAASPCAHRAAPRSTAMALEYSL